MSLSFQRLAGPVRISSVAAALFTASSKTVVRTMDLSFSAASDIDIGIGGANATTPPSTSVWYIDGTLITKTGTDHDIAAGGVYRAQWRGGLVLLAGEALWADASVSDVASITVCGVTGVS